MYTKLLRGTLIFSLLLNGFFIFLLTQNKIAVAPETSDIQEQTDTPGEDVATQPKVYESGLTYPLMRIVDGDTIIVGFENATEYVRLIGINAPELNDPGGAQCFAQEAMTHLQEIARTGVVILHFDESQGMRDSYNRLLAYVEIPDGVDLGEQMLADGYAREYTFQTPYARQETYKSAELKATTENLGLWAKSVCE